MKRGLLAVGLIGAFAIGATSNANAAPSYKRALSKVLAGKEPKHICFAWSAKLKQFACYGYSYETENAPGMGPVEWSIVLMSTTKGVKPRSFTIASLDRNPSNQKRKVHAAAVKQAKAALAAGGFVGFRGRGRSVGKSSRGVTVAGQRIRRRQTKEDEGGFDHADELQVRCAGAWKRIHVFGDVYRKGGNNSRSISVSAYATPDGKLLVTAAIQKMSWTGYSSDATYGEVLSTGCPKTKLAGVPAIQLTPPSAARIKRAGRINGQGYRLERAGNRGAAAIKYGAAVAADPSFLLARYNYASALVVTNQPHKGLAVLKTFKHPGCPVCWGFLVYSRKDKDWRSLRSDPGYRQLTAGVRINNPSLRKAANSLIASMRRGALTRTAARLVHPHRLLKSTFTYTSTSTLAALRGRTQVAAWLRKMKKQHNAGTLTTTHVTRCRKKCCRMKYTPGTRSHSSVELTRICFRTSVGGALHYDKVGFAEGPM